MRVKKLLAITLTAILLLGTFTFGYGIGDLTDTNTKTDTEETQQDPQDLAPVDESGDPESNDEPGDGDNPDSNNEPGEGDQQLAPMMIKEKEESEEEPKDPAPAQDPPLVEDPAPVEDAGQPEPEPIQEEEWMPEAKDPDNLGRPVKIDSPKLFIPRAEPKLRMESFSNNEDSEQPALQPGDIILSKTAEPVEGECNLWDIELTLTGIDGEQTSDTVLVIDRSGSMNDGTRFTDAKDAAKNFVDLVLDGTNDSNHRIAVVSFAAGTNPVIGFSSDPTAIKTAIGNIASPSGGTHTQAGLKQAGIVLNPSTADSQNIVLLSDGDPTYGYNMANNSKYDLRYPDVDQVVDSSTGIVWKTYYRDIYTGYENPTDSLIGDFNYNQTTGAGNALREKVGDFQNGPQTGSGSSSDRYVQNYDRLYYNAGNAAISEAAMIKNKGQIIYTISLDAGTEGTRILKDIASPNKDYTTDGDDLDDIYQEIAGNINYAATNAVITDPLGPYFDIPGINGSNYNSLITVSRGTLSWNDTTETITWDLGNISASDPATMTYQVAMDPSGFGQGNQPTNGHTYVEYTDIDNKAATKDFEVPKVAATCEFGELTIIKKVFIDGEEVLEDDTEFEFTVNGQTVTASVNQDGTITLLTGDYTVEETGYGDFIPDDTTQDVTVTPNGGVVTFVNRMTTPDGDVKIIKNIGVENTAVHEGVKFQLRTLEGDLVAEGYTDSNGELVFEDVPSGEYNLVEFVPDDFETSFTGRITVAEGETTIVKVLNNMIENEGTEFEDEGNTIKGYKFNRYEEGLEGWTIELYEEDGEVPIDTTVTDENGYYEFTGLGEGTYIVKEVMQEGWYNIEPISQTIVISGISGPTFVKHLASDSDLIAALPESEIEFVTEGRIGDLGGNATHELNIHTPPYVIQDDYWNLNWSNNGVPMPFKIVFDGTTLTYETGGQTLTYVPTSVDDIYDIMIRTRATKANSGVMINNLKLNGTPVPYTSVAVGNSNGLDILWMHNYNLTAGFTLEGESVMYWTEKDKPTQSHLAYQIKFGNAKDQGVFWADPFMNGEYADVTVYKVIEGEQVEMDFNFRIYEGEGTEGDIVAQTSVDINNPEFVGGLLEGTYTIGEQPVEGYITPLPYTFYIEEGESLEITLTNIERVPEPEPSMRIEKVADDYSVYVGEDVTYTITVTNTGDVDLDYVYVTDDELGYSETVNIPAGGSFSHSITTSYDSTGTKENTARAEYGIETNDYFMVEDTVEVEVRRRSTPSGTYRMTIEKEAQVDEVEVGDLVEFTVTVKNTGNRTLTNIEVVDDMTGLNETISLSPGESETFNVSVIADEVGTLTNTAEASHSRASFVQDSDSVRVVDGEEDIDEEEIPEGTPGTYKLSITKTANIAGMETINFGDTVEFTIVVTNTGDETLTNVLVKDEQAAFETIIDTLEPGESKQFIVQVAMPNTPGPYTNTAIAASTRTGENLADDTVFVEEPVPLAVPDTSANPSNLLYGLGALVSGVGIFLSKKKRR